MNRDRNYAELKSAALFLLSIYLLVPYCCAQTGSSLRHLKAGEAFLKEHNIESAANELLEAERGDHQPSWTLVWCHIDLGLTFDALGQRERAIREYMLALDTNDDTFNALAIATAFISKAPTINDIAWWPTKLSEASLPTVLKRIEPDYPAEALIAGIEGDVLIEVTIDENASVVGARVVHSLGLGLDDAALTAVRRWTFSNGVVDGTPTTMALMVAVHFSRPSRPYGWRIAKIDFATPDGEDRPTLIRANGVPQDKMNAALAEAASIDAAVSRVPTATLSMEIDVWGKPQQIQVIAASLPGWGEDAARTISKWQFNPGSRAGNPVRVACVVALKWFLPQ